MNLSSVSAIGTTKNLPREMSSTISWGEEKNIENCLKSIKNQTYPQEKIEIIVVDNNSTDKTKEIAKRFIDKVYNHDPEEFWGKMQRRKR